MARLWASCRLLGHELGLNCGSNHEIPMGSTVISSFSSTSRYVRHFVYPSFSVNISVSLSKYLVGISCQTIGPNRHLQSFFSSFAFACNFAKAWHIAGSTGEGIGLELRHGKELDCKN